MSFPPELWCYIVERHLPLQDFWRFLLLGKEFYRMYQDSRYMKFYHLRRTWRRKGCHIFDLDSKICYESGFFLKPLPGLTCDSALFRAYLMGLLGGGHFDIFMQYEVKCPEKEWYLAYVEHLAIKNPEALSTNQSRILGKVSKEQLQVNYRGYRDNLVTITVKHQARGLLTHLVKNNYINWQRFITEIKDSDFLFWLLAFFRGFSILNDPRWLSVINQGVLDGRYFSTPAKASDTLIKFPGTLLIDAALCDKLLQAYNQNADPIVTIILQKYDDPAKHFSEPRILCKLLETVRDWDQVLKEVLPNRVKCVIETSIYTGYPILGTSTELLNFLYGRYSPSLSTDGNIQRYAAKFQIPLCRDVEMLRLFGFAL